MAKQTAKIGDLFVVPLTDGSFAVGKILWRGESPEFRGDLQIGIYKRVPEEELSNVSVADQKPLELCYVMANCFEGKRLPLWQIVGQEPLADYESGLTRRLCGIHVYYEDQFLGRASDDEFKKLPNGSSQLPHPTEAAINRLFGLAPDPKTIPRPDDETSDADESFPWFQTYEWADALTRAKNFSPVKEALNASMSGSSVEMDESCEAVAAAEVVATAKGRPAQNTPEAIKEWAEKHKSKFSPSLIDLAVRAVERVREDSELQQEWDGTNTLEKWKNQVDDLLKRLRA